MNKSHIVLPLFNSTHDLLPELPAISFLWWFLALTIFFGSVLPIAVILKTPALRTVFVTYVLNILLAELIVVVYMVLFALETSSGPQIIGFVLCPLVDSIYDLCTLVIGWTELIISVTRAWALLFPLHFRRRRKTSMATFVCCGLWLVSAAIVVPYAALNLVTSWTSRKLMNRCVGISPVQHPLYTQVLATFAIIPPVCILLLYPLICKKYLDVRKVRTGLEARCQPAVDQANLPARTIRNEYESFLVLTWITLCVVLFWIPASVYQVLARVLDLPATYERIGGTWVVLWSLMHACLEPYVFMLTIRPLRQEISILLRKLVAQYLEPFRCSSSLKLAAPDNSSKT